MSNKVEVPLEMLRAVHAYVEIQVATNHNLYHDQDTLAEDIEKLSAIGCMPGFYYLIKTIISIKDRDDGVS